MISSMHSPTHFLNGLKCVQHKHGATGAVDALMEVFHYSVLENDHSLVDFMPYNDLLRALVTASHRGISCGTSCDVREGVRNLLLQLIPDAYYPKGRDDAEILRAFQLLMQNTGIKFSSQYCGNFSYEMCGSHAGMSVMISAILKYDTTINLQFPGDMTQGLSHMIDICIQNQLSNSLQCSCGGFFVPKQTNHIMSDFVIVSLGLSGKESRNEQKPKLVVPQEMRLKCQPYFLTGAVQMGLSGGHFLAIVNRRCAYVVLDDLYDSAEFFPHLLLLPPESQMTLVCGRSYSHMKLASICLCTPNMPCRTVPLYPLCHLLAVGNLLCLSHGAMGTHQCLCHKAMGTHQCLCHNAVGTRQCLCSGDSPVSAAQCSGSSPVPMQQCNGDSPVPVSQ